MKNCFLFFQGVIEIFGGMINKSRSCDFCRLRNTQNEQTEENLGNHGYMQNKQERFAKLIRKIKRTSEVVKKRKFLMGIFYQQILLIDWSFTQKSVHRIKLALCMMTVGIFGMERATGVEVLQQISAEQRCFRHSIFFSAEQC